MSEYLCQFLQSDIFAGIIVAGFAAFCGFWANAWHNKKNRLMSERIKYLSEAYTVLCEHASYVNAPKNFSLPKVEVLKQSELKATKSLNMLMLYGNAEQIGILEKLMDNFMENAVKRSTYYSELLVSLRNDLRNTLGHEPIKIPHRQVLLYINWSD